MKANYSCSLNRYAALENMNELSGDLTENSESNREQFLQHNNNNNKERKIITILGDSMVQKVKEYQLAK